MQITGSSSDSLRAIIEQHRPSLEPFEDLYRQLHRFPELSFQEEKTSAIAADHLRKLGFDVHAHVGGYGVAGVLHNGHGPTVLLRADMDALPLEEKTGLPYASKAIVKDKDGVDRPAMHACGHDTHVTSLMAGAELLHAARDCWSGTLICIFQPAEEILSGAKAMIEDGLYEKIPKPDVVLSQHVMRHKTGTVSIRSGRLLTAGDSFDVRIYGRGGHGSAPHTCVDPIVIGASIITRLQTIVSREVAPGEMAVLNLKLTVRTYDRKVRDRVVASIKRIVEAECLASGAVEKPTVELVLSCPATINDAATVETLKGTFAPYFKENLVETEPVSASEDFSLLATAVGAPYVMWTYGGVDANTWDEAVEQNTVDQVPNNHSPFFAPVIEPTLCTAIDAIALGALTFLKKKNL
ncbi:hypothetical protein BDV25DRAFT_170745 [Aspergillus avenaceus]|uniref:Peptidase M20 dimerisation domain-containing protein n=1 Tax=Aspergillus avenaceus TaxID=36643 RepID=A0A5N6TGF2_ASPAV|nr:hypothetical protein BDV25DRAFT_170745 [Aspergillus avenaceus]